MREKGETEKGRRAPKWSDKASVGTDTKNAATSMCALLCLQANHQVEPIQMTTAHQCCAWVSLMSDTSHSGRIGGFWQLRFIPAKQKVFSPFRWTVRSRARFSRERCDHRERTVRVLRVHLKSGMQSLGEVYSPLRAIIICFQLIPSNCGDINPATSKPHECTGSFKNISLTWQNGRESFSTCLAFLHTWNPSCRDFSSRWSCRLQPGVQPHVFPLHQRAWNRAALYLFSFCLTLTLTSFGGPMAKRTHNQVPFPSCSSHGPKMMQYLISLATTFLPCKHFLVFT